MNATHEVELPAGLRPADTAVLCAGVAARLGAGDVVRVLCRADRSPADLAAVEALARLHLTARRAGASLSVHRPGPDLRELLELLGLTELLGPGEVTAEDP